MKKQVYTISFSPTETSRRVAGLLAEAFDGEPAEIDLCGEPAAEQQIAGDSVCIFSVPCYGGRIPHTARQRLAGIHGSGTPAVVCVTFGNRAGEDALLELADTVEANGFRVIAGCFAATEHNIVHVYGQGRPDARDEEELRRFALDAAAKLKRRDIGRPRLPGKHPYKEWRGSHLPIRVDATACTSCGLCAAKCPVQAIPPDGRATDAERCINCMRCIQLCPQKSRSLPDDAVAALTQRLQGACSDRKENGFYL